MANSAFTFAPDESLELHLAEQGNPIYFNAKIFQEGRKPSKRKAFRHLLFRFQIPCVNLMFLGNRALAFSRNPSSRNWRVRWRCASGRPSRGLVRARGASPQPRALPLDPQPLSRPARCAERRPGTARSKGPIVCLCPIWPKGKVNKK